MWFCLVLLLAALPAVPVFAAPAGQRNAAKKSVPAKKKPAPKKKTPTPAPPKPPEEPEKPSVPQKPSLAREPWLGAIVVDAADGRVLIEDHADAKGYPASVLKLMLLLTAMEQVKEGRLTLADTVTVNPTAVSSEGADLRLQAGETFTVEDLLYACMMHSANDAAMALAEKLGGGTIAGYLQIINARAKSLGMTSSEFHTPSGLSSNDLDAPADITTPRDLALLCREVLRHPEALRFTSARTRVFRPDGGANKIPMETHNYILGMVRGCDGLKTGYLRMAGYCIAGTAMRKDRRVIAVILGATSEKSRNKLAAGLLEKGLALLAAEQAAAAPAAQ